MEKVTARQRHNIPQDISVLAYCGFSALDLDLLCETLLLLQKKIPDILLIMTGAKMQPFEEFIKKNKLMANVKHFGTLPYEDLGEILSCGDVMLLPYQNTTVNKARFPNRFGDYLAAGRPIATNNIGDHALIVKDEKLGVVTEPTAEAFAEGIVALLSQRGLLLQMGQNARRLAETQYTWKSVAQPMAELYAELLG
jgi:glycosyltransferase involved in cell wall biosynthesis